MRRPLVVSYGGGVNSLAMLVGYHERGEVPDAVVFSDTGGEKPETYFSLRIAVRGWMARLGFPDMTIVDRASFGRSKTGDQTLEEECLRLGSLPSRAYGYGRCADKWKIDPFRWWVEGWPQAQVARAAGKPVYRAIGFDAGEARRVKATDDPGFEKAYPLIEWGWTREACVEAIERQGLPVPVKSACFYCPSSTRSEVLALAERHPKLFARAVAIEQRAQESGINTTVLGLGRRFAWLQLVQADKAQQDLFPEAPVESCMVCEAGE